MSEEVVAGTQAVPDTTAPLNVEEAAAVVFNPNPDQDAQTTPPVEAKPEDKPEGKPVEKDGKPDNSQNAPEAYEKFDLKDATLEWDDAAAKAFDPIAKELNLTQTQAQRLVDIYATRQTDQARTMQDQFETVQETWRTQAKEDPEYGGAKFVDSVSAANKFLGAYGSPALEAALAETGMGNHPELIRIFAKAGKVMSDDTLTFGQASTAPRDPASILFPNQGK